MSRAWIAILAILAVLYAMYEGYIPGGMYIHILESKIKEVIPPTKEESLKSFPVSVSYEVTKSSYPVAKYDLKIILVSHASESVKFIMDPPVVVDPSGKTYNAILGSFAIITIYPNARIVKTYHFDTLPKNGNLYIDIYTPPIEGQIKKIETLKLKFQLNL